jgi:hypothetical protein
MKLKMKWGWFENMNRLKSVFDSIDVSTRGKRRNVVSLIIDLLDKIQTAEQGYLDRFPHNLQAGDAYELSEFSVDMVTEAMNSLADAY